MRKLNFCATQIKTVLCINKLRHIKHIVKSFLNKSTNTLQDNDKMRLNRSISNHFWNEFMIDINNSKTLLFMLHFFAIADCYRSLFYKHIFLIM